MKCQIISKWEREWEYKRDLKISSPKHEISMHSGFLLVKKEGNYQNGKWMKNALD